MLLGSIALTAIALVSSAAGEVADGRREFTEILGLEYRKGDGADPRQKLNLVLPKGVADGPLLLWIGGGAWSYVDRDKEMGVARQIAARGIAVASVGHRLSPATWKDPALKTGIRHPAHIEDIAEAFRWLREQAPKYGYSRDKIFVGGFSSGGHLSALLGADGRRLERVGLSKGDIRGVIPIAGAYDISDYHANFLKGDDKKLADLHVKAVFGDGEQDFADASPTTYVAQMSVPMLLISERSTYRYTKIYEEKIRAGEFKDVVVVNFHGLGHGDLWRSLSGAADSECRDLVVNFIRSRSAK